MQPNWYFASSVRATDRIAQGKHLMAEFSTPIMTSRARLLDHDARVPDGAIAAPPVQAG